MDLGVEGYDNVVIDGTVVIGQLAGYHEGQRGHLHLLIQTH